MLSRLPGLDPPSQVGVGLIGRLGRRQRGVQERKRETQQQSCLRKGVFVDIINIVMRSSWNIFVGLECSDQYPDRREKHKAKKRRSPEKDGDGGVQPQGMPGAPRIWKRQ